MMHDPDHPQMPDAPRRLPGSREFGETLDRLVDASLESVSGLHSQLDRLDDWAGRLFGNGMADEASRNRLALFLGGGDTLVESRVPNWTSERLCEWLGEGAGSYPLLHAGWRVEELAPGEIRLVQMRRSPHLAVLWAGGKSPPDLSFLEGRREFLESISVPGTRFSFAWVRESVDRVPRVHGVHLSGECLDPWA